MKKIIYKVTTFLIMLALLAGLVPVSTSVKADDFQNLNQKEITQSMGLGWNLGNQLEAVADQTPGETNWGNPVITEDLIKAVKAAGFKTIRIPIAYLSKIGKSPSYTIASDWLDRIQEVVDYCVNNDLFAIINMHGDGYQTIDGGWLYCDAKEQDTIKAKYKAVWKQIATRFKDYDEHLIFESMNEVSDMSYAAPKQKMYDNINAYNQIFVDTVRTTGGNNDKRWVLIPGWNTEIEYTAGDYGFVIPSDQYLSKDLPSGEKRIMISVHDYAPWDFCGGESGIITQWGEDAKDPEKTSVHSGQSFMAAQFKLLNEAFTSKGYPVVIGEFGAIDKHEDDASNPYYREWFDYKLCENSVKNGCIPVYWDNGYNLKYGFGLFDRAACTVTQQGIIDAMLRAFQSETQATGSSTGITLNKSSLSLEVIDESVTLKASLNPAASTDKIVWSSSDETIATVSQNGTIKPQTVGTVKITAEANGNKAVCSVKVIKATRVKLALYANETSSWSTIQSSESAIVSNKGGTYTLKLKGSKTMLSKIGSLYIKDVLVQSGVVKASIVTSAKIKLKSVKFNGVACKIKTGTEAAVNGQLTFDYCLLNQWVKDSEKIEGVKLEGSYYFTNAKYKDSDNTIEVTFTVASVKIKK